MSGYRILSLFNEKMKLVSVGHCLALVLAIVLPGLVSTQTNSVTTPPTPVCAIIGKVYTTCGTACPLTCGNYQNPPPCTLQCVIGCVCPDGTVEHEGGCVVSSNCPSTTPTPPVCHNGKEYTTCGTACPLTCGNFENAPLICTLQCVIGCVCPNGTVEHEDGCVAPSDCPLTTPTPPVCTIGKVYTTCGTACPLTCDNYQNPPPCTLQCVIGCVCPDGTVEHEGGCVAPSNCSLTTPTPPVCTIGKDYTTCGTACPLTCGNYQNPPPCTLQCVIGCVCPDGTVEHEGGCVVSSNCPSTTPTPPVCHNGKEYTTCGTACPLTCGNFENAPLICTLQCVIGCVCPNGTVEHEDGCVAPSDCPLTTPTPPFCTVGKVYTTCGTACPLTCDNYQNPPPCTLQCVIGCVCPHGTVEHEGGCVAPSNCSLTTPTPPVCTIGKDYTTCGTACPLTCDNYQHPPPCTLQCVIGCVCPHGTVEHEGGCVVSSNCPSTTPTPPVCPNGKEYTTCGTACPLTCGNFENAPLICTLQCVIGCVCPNGTVEHEDGCVAPSDCPLTTPTPPFCTVGKVYTTCGTACPLTCDNYQNPPPCTLQCVIGCVCPHGTVEHEGGCVAPSNCSLTTPTPPVCTIGKDYTTCGTACPLTCDNYQHPPPCTLQCVIGCVCPHGTVEHEGGCVVSSNCPSTTPTPPVCPNGKEYTTCGTACPLTCGNFENAPLICTLQCVIGCVCPNGTVEHEDGCVAPSDCPLTTPTPPFCTVGKVYTTCGTACPLTCDNYQNPPPCTLQCVIGCVCPHGTVEHEGGCVAPSNCSSTTPTPPVCPNGKEYTTCGTACPLTCGNFENAPLICTLQCVIGCVCPNGTVEHEDGCVAPSDCPLTTPTPPFCTVGKVYTTCGTACPLTCDNYQNPPPCTLQCVIGCVCPHGTVEHEGGCVAPSNCSSTTPTPPVCPNGKEYTTCGTACPLTCGNFENAPLICTLQCVIGCVCPNGTVEHEDGCVAPSDCPLTTPTPPFCTVGKVYTTCGTACPLTCDNYQNPPPCTLQCVIGCVCPHGTVEHEGGCVAPSNCSSTTPTPPVCPNGKEYTTCGTACPLTCGNFENAPLICTLQCVIGCVCPNGTVEHEDGCVAPSDCPLTTPTPPFCTVGKVYTTCGTACPLTCDNYQNPPPCTLQCVIGCVCPHGTVEHEGGCVAPSNCSLTMPTPPVCTIGKDYTTCGTACPLTCDNYQHPPPCPLQCVIGCVCPHGTVEHEGGCVVSSNCPSTTPTPPVCPNGKEYTTCGTACPLTCGNFENAPLICTLQCVIGCVCPNGTVEHEDGCVAPSDCPLTTPTPPVCTVGKVYTTCGTACPLTCDNYQNPPPCTLQCVIGCVCPHGTVEHEGGCVAPSNCSLTTPTPPVCTIGKDYTTCGTACPLTCDNYQHPPPCTLQCVIGCVCPHGTVEHEGGCVVSSNCPSTTPTPPVCPNGKEYTTCGTACPLTCGNFENAPLICTLQCVIGCVCPNGTVEHEDGCVAPSDCPSTSGTTLPPPVCSNGKEYRYCATACPLNCNNHLAQISCTRQCVSRCVCPNGKVEHEDGCVTPSECPSTTPTPPVCANGKEYTTCGTACPLTCGNLENPPLICTLQCVIGCVCPNGTVEHEDGCVAPSDCPSTSGTTPPPPVCSNGKEYINCATACPLNCNNHLAQISCTRQCVSRCVCPNGTVEHEDGCIIPSECPLTTPTPPVCANGKEYTTCGTACPLTCGNFENPPQFCTLQCVIGCVCPNGTVELEDGCVAPSDCPSTAVTTPPVCLNDKVYTTCGTACPLTCDNYHDPPQVCTLQCVIGCVCPTGMVEHESGCVFPSDCPVTTPPSVICTYGKVYKTCGTDCPLTCDNYQNPPQVCTLRCVIGCVCPPGSVEYEDGCVAPSDCQDYVIQEALETQSQVLSRKGVIGIAVVGAVVGLVLVMLLTLVGVAYYIVRRRRNTTGQLAPSTSVSMQNFVKTDSEMAEDI